MLPAYNYHTHTFRCRHAAGEDREYVEAAIEAGYQILGFSDHCPWIFKDDYVSLMRMQPEETEGYVHSLESLKKEYERDIKILIGFEAEYIPELMEAQDRFFADFPLDYMILGQHFLGNEQGSVYVGAPTKDETVLKQYVDTVIEAVKSGRYLYVAHPDVINFIGPDAVYQRHMEKLCRFLKEADIPVEINMLGAGDGRHYPSDRFFDIVKKTGNTCIVGIDAHAPNQISNGYGKKVVEKLIKNYSLPLVSPPLS